MVAFYYVTKGGDGKLSKLTLKQKRFADEYIITGNATESAVKAGYSKNTARSIGQENLTKPDIKNYIAERLKILDDEKIADQKEVLQYLSAVMRGEHKEKTLISIGDFCQEIVDIDVGAKDRLKAAELLGRRYKLFTDKVEVDANIETVVFVDDIGSDLDG